MDIHHLTADETLTTREVARMLGLAVRSVQLMVDRGDLQAWRTSGGHRRILADSVRAWLHKRPDVAATAPGPLPGPREVTGETSIAALLRHNPAQQHPPTVVLIEDSAHFQQVIRLMLAKVMPEVALHVAQDAVSGLLLCGAVRPDVLIVDLMLPGIDGAALISSLRSQPTCLDMRVLVVTALDHSQRKPYEYALDGLPVIEKKDLTQLLPGALRALLAQARSTNLAA